jgi:two-component system OmpR family sensor kinase
MFDAQRRFVADAAHELRTPITALVVQAENLEQADLSQDGRDRLASLKTGIRRTGHLLEQLLTLAKYDGDISKDKPKGEFDRVLKEIVSELLPVAQNKSVDLGFCRIEPVLVPLEPVALTVLARNLLDNALRHTPAGGQVDVNLFTENGSVVFTVEDTGSGIPDADFDRIFEPFFRGSRSRGEGSGLGLSIARRIIERCHGSIRLENKSAPGSGLRVIVRIPRD